MPSSIFWEAKSKQGIAEIEFRHFRQLAIANIDLICKSLGRFESISREFSFSITTDTGEDHLQFDFGKRSMFMKDLNGQNAVETGASLFYSLAKTGGVAAAVLVPAKSSLGSATEDQIFLRIGTYSWYQLFRRLRGDIADLITYTFVSSLETTPSLRDRMRIAWLRRTHPIQFEQKFARLSASTTRKLRHSPQQLC
jgi:hypothetical protein